MMKSSSEVEVVLQRLDSRLKHAGMTLFRNQLDAARLWGINRSDLK
jgi:DNA-binding protein Fis